MSNGLAEDTADEMVVHIFQGTQIRVYVHLVNDSQMVDYFKMALHNITVLLQYR